jgi:polyisoprenoid-binding protein YceI
VTRRQKTLTASAALAILIAIVGFGLWYQFFRDDAPPRVSLALAVESIESTATTSDTESGTTSTPAADTGAASGLDGSWTVTSSTDSFVGYRISEELASIGTTEAVGRTSSVEGTATVEAGTLTSASLSGDMTSLESDESRRDRALEGQSLETGTHPTATFELTEPIVLSDALIAGEATTITATGELTLHGVTQIVQIPLDVQVSNGMLVVVGSLDIALGDYEIAAPQSPSVVSVNDSGVLELQVFLSLAG